MEYIISFFAIDIARLNLFSIMLGMFLGALAFRIYALYWVCGYLSCVTIFYAIKSGAFSSILKG
jgi:hypothetical protein